jgi:hypothetical protein
MLAVELVETVLGLIALFPHAASEISPAPRVTSVTHHWRVGWLSH